MIEAEISPALRRFIAQQIGSVTELELILLMRRDAKKDWSAGDAARELRVELDWTRRQLDDLYTRGILARREGEEPRYGYGPGSPEIERLLAELAHLYTERRVTITSLIYAKPSRHIFSFADAFRLRRDK